MDNTINGSLIGYPGEILSSDTDSDEEAKEKRKFINGNINAKHLNSLINRVLNGIDDFAESPDMTSAKDIKKNILK